MKPCWSCGAQDEECMMPCDCAKCVDEDSYNDWKYNNPEEYQQWLDEQLGL